MTGLLEGPENSTLAPKIAGACAEASRSARIQEIELTSGDRVFAFSIAPVAEEAYLNIYGRDISREHAAKQELAAKEAQLRAAMDHVPGGIKLVDRDLNYVLVNPQYSAICGFPAGLVEAGGSMLDELRFQVERGDFGPGDADELVEEVLAFYRKGEAARWERPLANGRPIEVRVAPLPEGGYVNILTDISERKAAEAALRESEARYRALFDNAVVGIYRTTPDGRHLELNPALARMRGCATPAEFLAHFRDAGHPIYVDPAAREAMTRLMREQDFAVGLESETYRRDGTRFKV